MSRRATYHAGTRLATLVLVLAARPEGLDATLIDEELGISERTRLRYLRVLQDAFGELFLRHGSHIRLHSDWQQKCGGPRRAA